MLLAFKLAFRNLLGAGLRTWLNVIVLSFAFVLIVFYGGMLDGWHRQGINDTKEWQIGGGQYWHPEYDPFDWYTVKDSHSSLSQEIIKEVEKGNMTPLLLTSGSIYPEGRVSQVTIQGIDPDQNIIKIPTADLKYSEDVTPALIGKRMAEATHLKAGDVVLMRWRDKNGTFDAKNIKIVSIFDCNVPATDVSQIYLPLKDLQGMTGMENQATIITVKEGYKAGELANWEFKDEEFLLQDLQKMIDSKKGGSIVLEGLLLIIALLAIFDTQVLSIFRRQKEIGTYIALGLTRARVVGIFTVEGAAHSILAAIVGALYGIPFFFYLDTIGISFGTQDYGITMAEVIYPYYSLRLVLSTLIIVIVSATIVSYLPSRKISKMRPTDALKGKLQ